MALHFHRGVLKDNAIQHRVGDLLAHHLAASNILGRVQIVRHAKKKTGKVIPIATSSRFRVHFDEGDDADLSAGFSFNIPSDDIADYLSDLTPVTKDTFNGLSAQYRKDAFTLAGAADVRLIQKIRDALAEIAKTGGTEQEFDAKVDELTSAAGVQAIDAFTLDTAFQTAMQRAYSLGRYEQMTDPAVMGVLPYWQYWTVGDDRVRPEHRVLQGFTARAEDPVWRKIYPPNGFNCRCSVAPILASEAKEGSDEPGLARLPLLAILKVPQPGFGKVFAA